MPRLAPRPPARHHRPVIHLRSVTLRAPSERAPRGFPFDLPALRDVTTIEFRAPVTMLVGENGSGKSTLLEAVAIAAKAITAGSADATADPTLDGCPGPGRHPPADLDEATGPRVLPPRRGLLRLRPTARRHARRAGGGTAARRGRVRRGGAATPVRLPPPRSRASWRRCTSGTATASTRRSHGESFLHFFAERLVPGGIYFLDEPEAPLSPARQLSFLALLKEMEAAVVAGRRRDALADPAGLSRRRPPELRCDAAPAGPLRRAGARDPDPRLPARPRGVPAPPVTGSIPRVTDAPVTAACPPGSSAV